jgi:hypothetical protein
MGWSIRKSLSVLPGVRINLSRKGPRISLGIRGARISIGNNGNAKLYGGVGPVRYQKTLTTGAKPLPKPSLSALIKRLFG